MNQILPTKTVTVILSHFSGTLVLLDRQIHIIESFFQLITDKVSATVFNLIQQQSYQQGLMPPLQTFAQTTYSKVTQSAALGCGTQLSMSRGSER